MKVDLILPRKERGMKATIVSQALAQLAAVTPENVQLRCIDEFFGLTIPSKGAALVGISVRTPQYKRAIEISKIYKELGAKVVWGGIHPTALPEEKNPLVDCYVIGEGERTWPLLLRDFENGRLKSEYSDDALVDINTLPLPNRGIYKFDNNLVIESIATSRGCIFDCEYCTSKLTYGKGIRFVSLERIEKDLANIQGRVVALCDENLFNDRKRADEILDLLRESRKQFIVQFSPYSARDPGLAAKLQRAGVRAASVGFESVNPENFEGNQKYVSPSEWPAIVERMHGSGIMINGLFMFGLDFDQEDVFDKTLKQVERARIGHVTPGILTPFPGTRLYQRLEREGRILHRRWDEYDTKHVVFRPKNISPDVLQAKWDERYATSFCV